MSSSIHSDSLSSPALSRRAFVAAALAAPAVLQAKAKKVPIGLELYSVRDVLKTDLMGTVTAVAKMGYEVVEFFSPYYEWTPEYAKEVRKLMDGLGIKCSSTHNSTKAFTPEGIDKAIELNTIIGSKYIVMASAGRVEGLDGWKKVADQLNAGAEKFTKAGIRAGYHNHQTEFTAVEGTKPIEIIAKNTGKDVMLQLDIGTCYHAGYDPVKWIKDNPGRIRSVHCKDWSDDPAKGYKVLLGDGVAKWKDIIAAAEKAGGVEFYLVEQEGYSTPSIETVAQCLKNFKALTA